MGIFTGYYESSTKRSLKCAREFSLVTSFRVKKYDPVRYRNRTFQKFESVMYWITMFTYEANQYNLYRITFCTTS